MPIYLATQKAPNGLYNDKGAKSITFKADDRNIAEGYCAMHSLRFDGLKNAPSPQYGGPVKGDKPFTKAQKTTLSILCRNVFRDLDEMGLIDVPGKTKGERFDNWRHGETKKAVGIESFRRCRNSHYLRVKNWFSGMTGKSYNAAQITSPTAKEISSGDEAAMKQQAVDLITKALNEHDRVVNDPATAPEFAASAHAKPKGGAIHEGYALTIARFKNKTYSLRNFSDITKLPFEKLDQLLSTLRNRIAAREGRGSAKNRNKSQNRKKK